MAIANPEKKEWFTTRDVLWYLVFSGFAVNYMIRINLNIAIVSMIKQRQPKNDTLILTSECIKNNIPKSLLLENITQTSYTRDDFTSITLPRSVAELKNFTTTISPEYGDVLNTSKVEDEEFGRQFFWNEYQQGLILGAFFWLHWSTQVPGGLLAVKYGTKLVFGLSNLAGVLFCFLLPGAAYLGYEYLIVVRCVQGVLAGFAWPSMHNMTARWIPPNERSKFVTAYLGSSIGAAITFPMCGYIIDTWGWELVFYVSGVLGSIWYTAWYFLVFDSPSEHPRISESEKEYIITSLGDSVSKEKPPVPWKAILTSVPVWMNILAQWGGIWGLFTLMTHAPTYFKVIHGWNIKATGLLSGMPHFFRMVWAYIFSLFGDYLLRTNKMSRTNVRKLATAICCIGQGLFMLALAYSGCDYMTAIVFLTLATTIHGAVSTGALASCVDLSPNFASVQLGFCNGFAAFVGFLTPLITGYLTFQNQTVGQWQKVFWIASAMLIVTGTLYVLFAKSDLQTWNSPAIKQGALESELKSLKKKDDDEDEDYKNEKNGGYEKAPVIYEAEKEKI